MKYLNNTAPLVGTIGIMFLFLVCGCAHNSAIHIEKATFQLPKHFEKQISAHEDPALLPAGNSRLLAVEVEYKSLGVVHDMRPFESVLVINVMPPGVYVRPMAKYPELHKTDEGILAKHVIRITAEEAQIGKSLTLQGVAVLKERFDGQEALEEKDWQRTIKIEAYQPDLQMLQADKTAALFYLQDSLSRYDQLIKDKYEIPWETHDAEKVFDQADAIEAARLVLFIRSKQRADDARRHLIVASQSSDPQISTNAQSFLKDVEDAFTYWRNKGVPPPHRVEKGVELFATGKMSGVLNPMKFEMDKTFLADMDWHAVSQMWMIPIGTGVRLTSRWAKIGSSIQRTSVFMNGLSAYTAIWKRLVVEAQVLGISMTSSTSEVWQGQVLNPSITIGVLPIIKDGFRWGIYAGYYPDVGVQEDLRTLSLMANDSIGWVMGDSQTVDIESQLEARWSQYTFCLKLGLSSVMNKNVIGNFFDTTSFLMHYDLASNIWVIPSVAFQLDIRGLVYLTGSEHSQINSVGLGFLYNLENWGFTAGVYSPLASNSSLSSLQIQIGIAYTRWGALLE